MRRLLSHRKERGHGCEISYRQGMRYEIDSVLFPNPPTSSIWGDFTKSSEIKILESWVYRLGISPSLHFKSKKNIGASIQRIYLFGRAHSPEEHLHNIELGLESGIQPHPYHLTLALELTEILHYQRIHRIELHWTNFESSPSV